MDYLEFRLKVSRSNDNEYLIEILEAPAGLAAEFQQAGELDTIFSAARRLDTEFLSGREARELGKSLYEFLFGKTNGAFVTSRSAAEALEKGLRIRLQIEPPELSFLPWELLYDQERDTFLGASPDTLLTRCPINFTDLARPGMSALRVLVIIADPAAEIIEKYCLGRINAEKEVDNLVKALNNLQAQDLQVEFETLLNASTGQIHEELARDFSVVHFIGHGIFANETPFLLVKDEETGTDYIDGHKLGRLFAGRPALQLVVMNSCSSARESEHQPFKGLAGQLASHRMPAVVAHRNPILDHMAILFSKSFYGFLAAGFPIDVALNEARLRLYCESGGYAFDFATPVCYMAKRDGRLFEAARVNQNYSAYESQLHQRNRQFKRTKHVKFWLFGCKLFSFIREESTAYLGQKPEPILKSAQWPFCCSLERLPVLQWPAAAVACEYEVAVYTLKNEHEITKIYSTYTPAHTLDLAAAELNLENGVWHMWQARFCEGTNYVIRSGLFRLLHENERQELDALIKALTALAEDREAQLAVCAVYYSFAMYDRILAMVEEMFLHQGSELEASPLYKCLIEAYKMIGERFATAGLEADYDRVLNTVSYYETELLRLSMEPLRIPNEG